MNGELAARMTRWGVWNHKRRALVAFPLCFVVGHLVGYLGGVHLVGSALPDGIVAVLFGAVAVLIGGFLLALVD